MMETKNDGKALTAVRWHCCQRLSIVCVMHGTVIIASTSACTAVEAVLIESLCTIVRITSWVRAEQVGSRFHCLPVISPVSNRCSGSCYAEGTLIS